MGIKRLKNQIKDLISWPNINSDIKNIVENSEISTKKKKIITQKEL